MVIALLAGTVKGFCGKKISGKVASLKGTFHINTIRMLLCIIIGFFIVLSEGMGGLQINGYTLCITAVSGLSTALFVTTWIMCIRKGAYVMLDTFLMMGVGVTVALCKLFFNESITLWQYIGFSLLMLASCIMCSYSSNIKGNYNFRSLLLLIACGLLNGLADFSQKWFVKAIPDGSIAVFDFYTYVFSVLALLLFFGIINKVEKAENDGKSFKVFFVVGVMAACLFAYTYFKTTAAIYIPSAILYPLSSGAAIILSAIMEQVCFGMKNF